jgi:hypothetical protein
LGFKDNLSWFSDGFLMFGWSFLMMLHSAGLFLLDRVWKMTAYQEKQKTLLLQKDPLLMGAMTIQNSVHLLSSSAGSSAEQETPFFSLKSGAKRAHHFSFDLRQSWHLLMWKAGRAKNEMDHG